MKKGFVVTLSLLCASALLAVLGGALWVWKIDRTWSPLIEPRLRERKQIGSIRVLALAKDGREQWVGSLTSGRSEERQPLTLSDIPPQLTQAIVTLEDPRFLDHNGFDVLGILRATLHNILTFRYSQGGSTITQQLVKNVFLSKEKTIQRKFTELVLAALVEKRFSKDEILEAYMNEVYLGQLNSVEIHGVSTAAEYYFGKKLDKLDVPEMALLAAMIAGPGYYSPWRHPERTRARRDRVLKSLADAKLILPSELEVGLREPLPKNPNFIAPTKSAYLMDALREELLSSRTELEILKGGFDLKLGLDIDLQERAEKTLTLKSAEWGNKYQSIILAADPRNCVVRAYVGGIDYRVSQLDRIRQSKRSIGSLMKPLELDRLLDEDNNLNLASVLDDTPLEWKYDNNRQKWAPQNYDLKFRGKMTLRRAIEDSVNVPIVRVFFEREPSGLLQDLLEPVRSMGLELAPERALPSALLGTIEQTPRAVFTAYLRLARQAMGLVQDAGDFACRLTFEDKPSEIASAASPSPSSTAVASSLTGAPAAIVTGSAGFSQKGARLVIAAMEGGLRRGTGQVFGRRLPLDEAWASKTGTSSDKRDSWYIALSPNLVVMSWVGRDDNQETPFTGATGALPVVATLMSDKSSAKVDSPWNWPQPPELKWIPVEVGPYCKPTESLTEKISSAIPPPKSATPPPEPFAHESKTYVYELFRAGAEPKPCAN